MALKPKFSEEKFVIVGIDGSNEDGTKRQDLLAKFSENISTDNLLQFRRVERINEKSKHQVIEITINDQIVGELDDEDYIRYEEHIHSARKGRVQIFTEEMEDGSIHYTCNAYITIPYVNSEEEKASIRKRKQVVFVMLILMFMAYGVKEAIGGAFRMLIFAVLISAAFYYFGFIRDPHKDDAAYQFIATGKKKKSV